MCVCVCVVVAEGGDLVESVLIKRATSRTGIIMLALIYHMAKSQPEPSRGKGMKERGIGGGDIP